MDHRTFTGKYHMDMGYAFISKDEAMGEPLHYFIYEDMQAYTDEVISADSSDERLLEIAELIAARNRYLFFSIDEIVSDLKSLRQNLH